MRQTQFGDKAHFEKYINRLEGFKPKAIKRMSDGIDHVHTKRLWDAIYNKQLRLLIAKYTFGFAIPDLQEQFDSLIQDTKKHLEFSGSLSPNKNLEQYIECVQLLAFCYIFNASEEDVRYIVDHIPFTGDDRLADFLIKASIKDYQVTASRLAFPDIYQPLMNALSLLHEPEAYSQKIQQFLDGYYPGLRKYDVTWHDSHKEQDPEYCFHFGYWIFEAAALMVFTRCDDSPFRDHPFYPTDLVDWKKSQEKVTW